MKMMMIYCSRAYSACSHFCVEHVHDLPSHFWPLLEVLEHHLPDHIPRKVNVYQVCAALIIPATADSSC